MANRFAELEAAFTADTSGFRKGVADVKGGFQEVESAAGSTGNIIKGILGANIVQAGLGAAFDALKGSMFDTNSLLQQSNIAFTSMFNATIRAKTGVDDFTAAGTQAKTFLNDLKQFAAATPFEFPELVDASKKMMAFGFSAEQVKPLLTAVGDASAGLGGGAPMMNRMILALGQMQAKSKVASGEMLQLVETGVPAWDMLAKKIGVDVPTAMQMVEKRMIDSKVMIEAFQEGIAGGPLNNMMAQQSKSFDGLMSTIKDTLNMAAADGFKPFFELATKGLQGFVNMLSTDAFTDFVDGIASGAQVAANALEGLFGILFGDQNAGMDLLNAVGLDPDAVGTVVSTIQTVQRAVEGLFGIFASTGGDRAGFFTYLGFSEDDANKLGAVMDAVQGKIQAFVGVIQSTGGDRAGFFEMLGMNQDDANTAGALLDLIQTRVQGVMDFVGNLMSGETAGGILAALGLDTATPAIDAFASVVTNLGSTVLAALPGALQAVASGIDAVRSGFDAAGQAVQTVQQAWDGIGPGAQAAAIAFAGVAAAGAVVVPMVTALSGALAVLPAVLGLVALGIQGVAASMLAAMIAAAPVTLIVVAIAAAIGLLAAAWATDFGGIQEKTFAAVAAVQAFADAIMNGDIAGAFSGWGEAAQAALGFLGDRVGEIGQSISDAFTDATRPIADAFQAASDAASAAMDAVASSVGPPIQAVGDFLNAVRIIVTFFELEFVNAVVSAGASLASSVAGWLAPITGFFQSATAAADSGGQQVGQAVNGMVQAGLSILSTIVGVWVAPFLSFAAAVWPPIQSGVQTVVSGLAQFVAQTASDLLAGAQTWITNATQWAGELWGRVSGPLASYIGQIVGTLTSAAGQLLAAGGQMASQAVQGFIDGISAGTGRAVAAIQSWASSVIDAAKSKYGIQSPSTVFADMGGETMRGFEGGILDNGDLPSSAINSVLSSAAYVARTAAADVAAAWAEGFGSGLDKEKTHAVDKVQDWITAMLRGASDSGVAGNDAWFAMGQDHAKAYVAGILSQQQGLIEDTLATARTAATALNSAITEGVGDLTIQQARQVRDAVEAAATAEQKVLDARQKAQEAYLEMQEKAGKKGYDEAVKQAQQAANAVDAAVQAAAKATRKVQEVTSDSLAKNAADAEKAQKKMADDAAREAERAAKAIIAEANAAREAFQSIMGGFGPKAKGGLGDDIRGVMRGLDIGSGLLDILEPAKLNKHSKAIQEWGDAFKKMLGKSLADLSIPVPNIDKGAAWSDALHKFGKEQGRVLRNAISSELGGKTIAGQAVVGWQQYMRSADGGLVADEWGNLLGSADMTETTLYWGEEQGARFVTGFQRQFATITAKGSAFFDKPMDHLVKKFEEAGKKAGDALKNGVVHTIEQLNKLAPLDLDKLLPGHEGEAAKGKPNVADPKNFNPLKQAQMLHDNFAAMSDAALRTAANSTLGPGRIPLAASVDETMTRSLREWIIQMLINAMMTNGFRMALGDDNPNAPEPVFATRMATGGMAFRPTAAVIGDNRNAAADPEHVTSESRLARIIRQNTPQAPVYVYVGDEQVAARVVRSQNRRMARGW